MLTIMLVLCSIVIWVIRTIRTKGQKGLFWMNFSITSGTIIFWSVYIALVGFPLDSVAGLAAVIYILCGFISFED